MLWADFVMPKPGFSRVWLVFRSTDPKVQEVDGPMYDGQHACMMRVVQECIKMQAFVLHAERGEVNVVVPACRIDPTQVFKGHLHAAGLILNTKEAFPVLDVQGWVKTDAFSDAS